MATHDPRTTLNALTRRNGGKTALVPDPFDVCRARIFDVRVDDGAMLHARYQLIETPGLNGDSASSQVISAHASVRFATPTYWAASYVGWQIFFDPSVIARVLEIVAGLPAGTTYRDGYTSRPAPKGSRFVSIQTPGPCAAELFEYLGKQSLEEHARIHASEA